jgi:hypothetical protein
MYATFVYNFFSLLVLVTAHLCLLLNSPHILNKYWRRIKHILISVHFLLLLLFIYIYSYVNGCCEYKFELSCSVKYHGLQNTISVNKKIEEILY